MFKIKECILHVIQTGKGWHKIVFCLSNYDAIKICSNQIKFLLNRSIKKISKVRPSTPLLPVSPLLVLVFWGGGAWSRALHPVVLPNGVSAVRTGMDDVFTSVHTEGNQAAAQPESAGKGSNTQQPSPHGQVSYNVTTVTRDFEIENGSIAFVPSLLKGLLSTNWR